jgi:predicted HTH transcriptional regulator
VVQTDTDGRLLATTLVPVGSLLGIVLGGVAILGLSFGIVWLLSRRYLRVYFALRNVRVLTLDEALRIGEGQTVEFKRRLSDDPSRTKIAEDELLKSIAAFANTNDGVIFIGIDDCGHIVGLELDFKQRDRLEQKIRQLARSRIRPIPVVQVGFENARGLEVARVTVPRGEEPADMIGGVVYIRNGSSDVQAQPEDLRRLIVEYAR